MFTLYSVAHTDSQRLARLFIEIRVLFRTIALLDWNHTELFLSALVYFDLRNNTSNYFISHSLNQKLKTTVSKLQEAKLHLTISVFEKTGIMGQQIVVDFLLKTKVFNAIKIVSSSI